MRVVSAQELAQLPNGTVFYESIEFGFDTPCIKISSNRFVQEGSFVYAIRFREFNLFSDTDITEWNHYKFADEIAILEKADIQALIDVLQKALEVAQ